ncbi:YraN family protein [Patescibacteria group bacterium]|nr:YraN family protein [Patescibacteria group bacterium]MBP9709676.1 YraN family protein [Patescibacteria group bacterium]
MKSGSQKPKNKPKDRRRIEAGRLGEEEAAAFLITQGFRVVAKNWRCRLGEIDLIIKKDQEIRFVEVKFRKTHSFGYPEASVTRKKLSHLQAAAEIWLRQQLIIPPRYQFDVVAISLLTPQTPLQIEWIQGV